MAVIWCIFVWYVAHAVFTCYGQSEPTERIFHMNFTVFHDECKIISNEPNLENSCKMAQEMAFIVWFTLWFGTSHVYSPLALSFSFSLSLSSKFILLFFSLFEGSFFVVFFNILLT